MEYCGAAGRLLTSEGRIAPALANLTREPALRAGENEGREDVVVALGHVETGPLQSAELPMCSGTRPAVVCVLSVVDVRGIVVIDPSLDEPSPYSQ